MITAGRTAILSALAASLIALAPCAASDAIAPELKKDIDCMVNALKFVPEVDRVTVGMSSEPTPDVLGDQLWTYPYIQYRGSNDRGQRSFIRFITERRMGSDFRFSYFFSTVISGLSTAADPLSDWQTSKVAELWKRRCGVEVSVLMA